jgi:hypothetical protein
MLLKRDGKQFVTPELHNPYMTGHNLIIDGGLIRTEWSSKAWHSDIHPRIKDQIAQDQQGNHAEDAKEYYFNFYKDPQGAYPYSLLDAYVQATKRFYSMITSFEVRDLMITGEKTCVLTRYQLQPPGDYTCQ